MSDETHYEQPDALIPEGAKFGRQFCDARCDNEICRLHGCQKTEWSAFNSADWYTRAAETPWQPIETAPRDGTEILAYDAVGPIITIIEWNGPLDGGCWIDQGGYCFSSDEAFSHWMPLPPPPGGA